RLFSKHGVDTELLIEDSGGVGRRIGADVHFGVIGIPAVIPAVAEGRSLKVLASLDLPRDNFHVVAQHDIRTPDGPPGERIGVTRIGTGYWISSVLALEHLGLDPKRDGIAFVELGTLPQMVLALEAGDIDGAILDPAQSAQLRSKGFSLLLDMSQANISTV